MTKKDGEPGLEEAAPHYLGHRERLRDRFALIGGESFTDAELLEALLHIVIPRMDTKELAKTLLRRFGSVGEVLGAPRDRLAEIKGLGPTTISHLKVIEAVGQRTAKGRINPDKPLLSSWSALIEYCRAQMAFEAREQFRVLFLDKKNRLIADEVQATGTVDHTPVYPREIIKRALEHSASALILVHNHPSGDPAPSSADVQMTRQIADTAKPLGITVHDHVIVGKTGHASLKTMKLL